MIEAVVAIVVIGMTVMPITLLISQSLDQLRRVAEANTRAAVVESALSIMDPVNPLETPTGQVEMGDISLSWNSEVLVPPNTNIQIGSGLAGFELGFYDVEVELSEEGRSSFSFSLRKVGYKRRQIDAMFLGNSQ